MKGSVEMSLKHVFNTMKQPEGLVKRIDQYLAMSNADDPDRNNNTNSPSEAYGCSRANYYKRTGVKKDSPNPRLIRIYGNGHGVHKRLQAYLTGMGVLLMKETPLFHIRFDIMGHTDGIIAFSPILLKILEIKSINTNQFRALKEPLEKHIGQGQVYLFCIEEHRKYLRSKYVTLAKFKMSERMRAKQYENMYHHLKDDDFEGGISREDKIAKKVKEHLELDNILFKLPKAINEVTFLYEDKNTQELKEFNVQKDERVLEEVLEKYEQNTYYYKQRKCPPRECTKKPTNCDYANTCFTRGGRN
jgi:hypothetical protein